MIYRLIRRAAPARSRSFAGLLLLLPLFGLRAPIARAAPPEIRTQLPVLLVPAAEQNHALRQPDMLIFHYTHCSLTEAFEHYQQGRVSAHFTVDRSGEIYQHVDELEAAHHAGVSYWRRGSVNQSSIGIEIVNRGPLEPGDAGHRSVGAGLCRGTQIWEPFAEAQVASIVALSQDILQRYVIDPFDVIGHADVAPARKQDPGPVFPWLHLARSGIGVAYDPEQGVLVHGAQTYPVRLQKEPSVATMQHQLASLGYGVPLHGQYDWLTSQIVLAFNSHYLGRFESDISDEMVSVLDSLWRWRNERQTLKLLTDEKKRSEQTPGKRPIPCADSPMTSPLQSKTAACR